MKAIIIIIIPEMMDDFKYVYKTCCFVTISVGDPQNGPRSSLPL